MEPAIYLVFGVIFGIICAAVASAKGRSVVGWFFLGFLFGWIPLVIVACLSNLKEDQAYRDRQSRENRRLREQLRQERIKGDAFRTHTQMRLDMHDHQLGVDTRATYQALPGAQQQPAMLEGGPDPLSDSAHATDGGEAQVAHTARAGGQATAAGHAAAGGSARQWHYESNGQVHGPIVERELLALLKSGRITGSTLLWTEDLGDWRAANQIRALQAYITS